MHFKNSKLSKGKLTVAFLLTVFILFLFYFISPVGIILEKQKSDNDLDHFDEKKINEINLLLNQSESLMYSDPDSARFLAEKGLEAALRNDYFGGIHRSYNIVGVSYLTQSQYRNALNSFHTNLEIARKNNNNKQIIFAYNNIGAIYIKAGQPKNAMDAFLNAELLSDSIDEPIGIINSLRNNIGQIYLKLGDYIKAKEYYFLAYEGFQTANDLNNLASVATNIADYYFEKDIPDSANYYFDYAMSLANEINNKLLLKNIKTKKGHFLLSRGDYNGAIALYYASDSLDKVLNGSMDNFGPSIGLSRAYLLKGNFDKALQYANHAYAMVNNPGNEVLLYKIYEVYADIYEFNNDYQIACEYYRKAQNLRSEHLSQTEAYGIFQVELEHLNRQMVIRDFEMEKKQLLMSKNKNTFRFIIVILVLLIVILSLAYFYYLGRLRYAEKARQHQLEIKHSYEQNRAAIEAENNERRRLGMELHDGIGPLISLTKLNISNILQDNLISQQRRYDLLYRTSNYLDDILKEMRGVSNNLAPLILLDKGLQYALRDLLLKINCLNNYNIQFNITGLAQPLGEFFELALYRTIQEILNNIVRHAEANEIVVEIVEGEDDITVMIEDNGKGFIVDEVEQGLGLISAKSRIEGLLGKLLIDSKPGRGTIVSIILPLKNLFIVDVQQS